jgi:CheY-like chemotaxis protein
MEYLSGNGEYSNQLKYPMPRSILLNLNLPDSSGIQVLQKIKTNQNLKHIPVIILTASDSV